MKTGGLISASTLCAGHKAPSPEDVPIQVKPDFGFAVRVLHVAHLGISRNLNLLSLYADAKTFVRALPRARIDVGVVAAVAAGFVGFVFCRRETVGLMRKRIMRLNCWCPSKSKKHNTGSTNKFLHGNPHSGTVVWNVHELDVQSFSWEATAQLS